MCHLISEYLLIFPVLQIFERSSDLPWFLQRMLADRDTQFSNKHAEMLKIWKFAHKLDRQVFLVHVQWEANSVERVSDASPR